MPGMDWSEHSHLSGGGTELSARRLEKRLPAELLDRFQIMLGCYLRTEPNTIPIFWSQLLPKDPQGAHLAGGGWQRYARIVYVSNWQAREHMGAYGVPWSRFAVIPNGIEPIAVPEDRFEPIPADRPVRLVYTSTPHRGLHLLLPVFDRICEERDDVELHVYSSMKLYGWEREDGLFEPLYEALRAHPKVTYHGSVPNDELREALRRADVLAYPSIYPETSCLCLIEAMSAGLVCVHPNFGCLYETAAGWTRMYQFHPHPRAHALRFHRELTAAIDAVRAGDPELRSTLAAQKQYADRFHRMDRVAAEWEALLRGILDDEGQAAWQPPGAARTSA
jgi:UDP-glucose:(glucosyl)LPS alpha-1,2-glucosyltransferase